MDMEVQKMKAKPIRMSEEEKRWRAEDDARALKAYAEIVRDKARMAAARKKLEEQQKDINTAIKLSK